MEKAFNATLKVSSGDELRSYKGTETSKVCNLFDYSLRIALRFPGVDLLKVTNVQ